MVVSGNAVCGGGAVEMLRNTGNLRFYVTQSPEIDFQTSRMNMHMRDDDDCLICDKTLVFLINHELNSK